MNFNELELSYENKIIKSFLEKDNIFLLHFDMQIDAARLIDKYINIWGEQQCGYIF